MPPLTTNHQTSCYITLINKNPNKVVILQSCHLESNVQKMAVFFFDVARPRFILPDLSRGLLKRRLFDEL